MKNFDEDFIEWLSNKYEYEESSSFYDLSFEFQQGVYLAFFREKGIDINTEYFNYDEKKILPYYLARISTNPNINIRARNYSDCLKQAIERAKKLYEEEK